MAIEPAVLQGVSPQLAGDSDRPADLVQHADPVSETDILSVITASVAQADADAAALPGGSQSIKTLAHEGARNGENEQQDSNETLQGGNGHVNGESSVVQREPLGCPREVEASPLDHLTFNGLASTTSVIPEQASSEAASGAQNMMLNDHTKENVAPTSRSAPVEPAGHLAAEPQSTTAVVLEELHQSENAQQASPDSPSQRIRSLSASESGPSAPRVAPTSALSPAREDSSHANNVAQDSSAGTLRNFSPDLVQDRQEVNPAGYNSVGQSSSEAGWGIRRQSTPPRGTNGTDEMDELDEETSVQYEAKGDLDTPSMANGSDQRGPRPGSSPSRVVKDIKEQLQRASQQHAEETAVEAAKTSVPPWALYWANPKSPTRSEKAKERAHSEAEPPQSSFARSSPTSTTSKMKKVSTAHVNKKYKGYHRMHNAVMLALEREDTFLDIAMTDDDMTCWIRCINWDMPDAPESDGSSQDKQKKSKKVSRSKAESSQNSLACGAEMLAQCYDAAQNKWRIMRLVEEHSEACDNAVKMLAKLQRNDRESVIDSEEDPELAAAIEAALLDVSASQARHSPELPVAGPSGTSGKAARKKREEDEPFRTTLPEGRTERSKSDTPPAQTSESISRSTRAEASQRHQHRSIPEDDTDEIMLRRVMQSPQRGEAAAPAPSHLYKRLDPSSSSNAFRHCSKGDAFETVHDLDRIAAATLSRSRAQTVTREGDRFGIPYHVVYCHKHFDLATQQLFDDKDHAGRSWDCPAQVRAFQRKPGGHWTVGQVVLVHSPSCKTSHEAQSRKAVDVQANIPVTHSATERTSEAPQLASDEISQPADPANVQDPPNEFAAPLLGKQSTFDDVASLKLAACTALSRTLQEVEVKEEPHLVFRSQKTCNIYCKNYFFSQPQANAAGWSLLRPGRWGLGTSQSAKCMAFVEGYQKSTAEPWRVGSFKIDHSPRCQADYDEAKQKETLPPPAHAAGQPSKQKPKNRPNARDDGNESVEEAESVHSESHFDEQVPPLNEVVRNSPEAHQATPEMSVDSEIQFVGQQEAPVPPTVQVGDVFANSEALFNAVQEVSAFVNRGSEVKWTQRIMRRNLACKYADGYHRDHTTDTRCNFHVRTNQIGTSTKLKISNCHLQHSPTCLVKHGNAVPGSQTANIRASTRQAGAPQSGSIRSERDAPQSHRTAASGQGRANHVSSRKRDKAYAGTTRAARPVEKPLRKPSKPRRDSIYNSVHYFTAAVKAYSAYRSPHARLRNKEEGGNKKKGALTVLYCPYPGCSFMVSGASLQDDKGRELEGFQTREAHTKHSIECCAYSASRQSPRPSGHASDNVVEIPSSSVGEGGSEPPDDLPHVPGKRRRDTQSDASNVRRAKKKRRVAESEEPMPLAADHEAEDGIDNATIREPSTESLPPRPATRVSPPSRQSSARTPTPLVQTAAREPDDEDLDAFLARYRQNIKEEPQSPERPPERIESRVRLYTGRMFDSRDEFVDAILRHTEEINPGCRLAVANTDPARVRVYCMRPDCDYSFNSVYEHGARRIPAVKVTANRREHSAACMHFYASLKQDEQRVHFDPPTLDQEIGDWHDFESAVQAHTDSVNPGCELRTTNRDNNCRIFCPHRDLGCRYNFLAKFDIDGLQEGRVKVTKITSEHSDGCLEHHRRIAEEEAEEEEAMNPGRAVKRINPAVGHAQVVADQSPQRPIVRGPGPHVGDEFEDEATFRHAVEEHSQQVNPGSLLDFRRPTKDNSQVMCRLCHTGCRYEFYAAFHPPASDGTRRLVITDVTPTHHDMCVAELVLRGRRPAPDNGTGRPRRGRHSGGSDFGKLGSQATQTSPRNPPVAKAVARKSTQTQSLSKADSRRRHSDMDFGRVPLRESNLMNHTSMSLAKDGASATESPSRKGRPPLFPPGQKHPGRSPLPSRASGSPARIKRTRFEGFPSSSSSASVPQPLNVVAPSISDQQAAHLGADSEAPNASSQAGFVGLGSILPASSTAVLARLGYQNVSDLVRVGVTKDDWPGLNEYLRASEERAGSAQSVPALADIDLVERFLLERRVLLAFEEEAQGSFLPDKRRRR